MDATQPSLSAVVVSINPLATLERCLASLAAQGEGALEVVIVRDPARDTSHQAELAALRGRYPAARWVAAPDAATVPRMRALGLAEGRGTVIALIEDDCLPAPDWCRAVLAAHGDRYAAVGGAIEPDDYRRGLDWAVFFNDYARFMLPFAPHETWVLPGNNVSYPRRVVSDLVRAAAERGLEEAFVHKAWHQAGRPMKADPAIVVRIVRRSGVSDVTVVPFHHARAYAGHRAESAGLKRWLLAAGTLALPAVLVGRIISRVARRGRHSARLVQAFGWLLVYIVCWSAGEWCGYVTGPGRSARYWR